MSNETTQGFYCARVEVLQGDRRISDLMATAGLGLTGIGVQEVLRIDYKPGEDVDEERVKKAMDAMIAESNAINASFKIHSYKILEIKFVLPK